MSIQSPRDFDIVVFGASAFTGQQVVEYLARQTFGTGLRDPKLRWAIAGRSPDKLRATLSEAVKHVPELRVLSNFDKNINRVGLFQADVNAPDSLDKMCASARVVLNIVGPFALYGEPVVRSAIKQKSHYLDLSGEPIFITQMMVKYDALARQNGVTVVSSAGFDVVPAETLLQFLERKFEGELNSAEGFVQFRGYPMHTGTYLSAIGAMANERQVAPLRRDLYARHTKKFPPPAFRLASRPVIHYSHAVRGWCTPYPLTDAYSVALSQRLLFELHDKRPVQFLVYQRTGSFMKSFLTVLFGALFMNGVKVPFIRSILARYPKIGSFGGVSEEGPTRKQMETTTFRYVLVGRGWSSLAAAGAGGSSARERSAPPDRELRVELVGPDPGYRATALAMVECGLRLLNEPPDRIPTGVVTPGVAFRSTALIEALEKAGYRYSVLAS